MDKRVKLDGNTLVSAGFMQDQINSISSNVSIDEEGLYIRGKRLESLIKNLEGLIDANAANLESRIQFLQESNNDMKATILTLQNEINELKSNQSLK